MQKNFKIFVKGKIEEIREYEYNSYILSPWIYLMCEILNASLKKFRDQN